MSDHWNSIANLLKTPSLNPTAKKTDGPPKPTKPTLPSEDPVQQQLEQTAAVEPAKSKAEPSRLRSSWDAVATFFGVAAPEQPAEPPQTTATTNKLGEDHDSRPVAAGGRKNKPSMWGQPAEESEPAPPAKSEPRTPHRLDAENESQPSRSSDESRDRGRSRGRDRDNAPIADKRSAFEDSPFVDADPVPRRAQQPLRDEPTGAIDPERRSQRQPPRRGRQADVRADVAFGEPIAESGFGDDLPPVSRSPEADRPARPERGPRQERGPRPERTGRDDRSSRPPRLEGEPRPERAPRPARDESAEMESRSERPVRPARPESVGDRPPRADRGDRPPRGERADRPPRTETGDRQDRPARPERADRPPRPERNENSTRSAGPSRGDLPERTEGGERRPQRDRPERTDRSGAPRGNRDALPERRPNPAVAKKPSGFGAGIHDDDVFGFEDGPSHTNDDFEQVGDRNEIDSDAPISRDSSDQESRPRRRRGRGRRSESRGSEGSDAALDPRDEVGERDDDDASDFISKNSRIPSWQDTIGTLVAANMENHQRNQSQNRGPRGRGPRRDR